MAMRKAKTTFRAARESIAAALSGHCPICHCSDISQEHESECCHCKSIWHLGVERDKSILKSDGVDRYVVTYELLNLGIVF